MKSSAKVLPSSSLSAFFGFGGGGETLTATSSAGNSEMEDIVIMNNGGDLSGAADPLAADPDRGAASHADVLMPFIQVVVNKVCNRIL